MGLSGFVALAFEVVWFRALVLVFGSTTYSFCGMLGVFLLGTAAGSLFFGWIADRVRNRMLLLAMLEWAIGFYTFAWMYRFNSQPEFLLAHLQTYGFTWGSMTAARFLITLKFLLVPTMLMGLAFTTAAKILRGRNGRASRTVADVYISNTLGDMLGAVIGGFVLLPWLGIEKSVMVLSVIAVGTGLFVYCFSGASLKVRVPVWMGVAGILATIALHPPRWDHRLMAAGAYFAPWTSEQGGKIILRDRLRNEELVYYREGVTATVSTTRTQGGGLYFSMDGKVEADTSRRGMTIQRMLGHLPMLFHPDPRRVINLGLGAGVTFGALGCYPVERLEVVEIEPATIEVSKIWSRWNHDVLNRSDIRVTINDGRNHFFSTPVKYDVITSDPFEPVVGGAAHLFTVDHFAIARDCLNDNGIMCQWVPMYEMSERDFLTILRSFVHVFPRSILFFTGVDTILLGFKGDLQPDPDVLRRRFEIPAVRESLAQIGYTNPELILCMVVADMSRSRDFIGPGPLNTDDRPVIEFSTPKSAMIFTTSRNQKILLNNFTPLPENLYKGLPSERAQLLRNQHDALRIALQANLRDAAGDRQGALDLLLHADALAPGSPVIRNEISTTLMALASDRLLSRKVREASQLLRKALEYDDSDFGAYYQLVMAEMSLEDAEAVQWALDRAMSIYPDSPQLLALRGTFRFNMADRAGSLADFRRALDLAPRSSQIRKEYAYVLGKMGDGDGALKASREADRLWDEGT